MYLNTDKKEKFTNVHNWPEELVKSILKDRYHNSDEAPSDFSATQIINPIQQTILKERYKDSLKIFDISSAFWSFVGNMAHNLLEESWAEVEGVKAEERLYTTVEGKVLSGKIDCFANGELRDYKTTKCYKVIKGDYADWSAQLNVYAYLLRQNGYEVKAARIIAILWDWSKQASFRDKNYPESQVQEIPIKLWSFDAQESYVTNRISMLTEAAKLRDDQIAALYSCSDHSMWSDTKDWAAMKEGAARATKTFQSETEGKVWLAEQKPSTPPLLLVERKTERTRCMSHCAVSEHCVQHQQYLKEKGNGDQ